QISDDASVSSHHFEREGVSTSWNVSIESRRDDTDDDVDDISVVDARFSGQASYQKSCQGIIVDYNDWR
ncbi:hypothetical protein, partial [Staphylococcus aureus]|uniref:hypothetical protein n=1 Tax=Staphylococcus aureus TaxID=1280 RepID=UPI0038B30CC7